jgi:glycosidase
MAAVWAGGSAALGQATVNPALPETSVQTPAQKAPAKPGWWNRAVFYEVFVRSFADARRGPLANDGIGDLQGLIERLDYLNDGDPKTDTDLGVTALWLMPIAASPSYHGYDTTDYYRVEPAYGTNEDFKRLISEAHARGIRIIVDLVLNHCSDQHPWFKEAMDPASPRHNWFIWADKRPAYKGPWNQNVWHRVDSAKGAEFYYGLFSRNMPDLNYTNPDVTAEANRIAEFWLKEMGADGFRLDAIRHLIEDGPKQDNTPQTHAWLKNFRTHYKGVKDEAFTIGEVWAPTPVAAAYVGEELDASFDFDLATAIIDAAGKGQAKVLAQALARNWASFPDNQFGSFLANHDQTRVMTQLLNHLKGDRTAAEEAMRLAAGLLMALPGVPFVYYGEELGMVGDKPDPMLRTPMPWSAGANAGFSKVAPWSPFQPGWERGNVESAGHDRASLLSWYRTLIRARLASVPLREGDLTIIDRPEPSVLALVRGSGAERVLVVANLGAAPVPVAGLRVPGGVGSVETARDLFTNTPAGLKSGADGTASFEQPLSARSIRVVPIGPAK